MDKSLKKRMEIYERYSKHIKPFENLTKRQMSNLLAKMVFDNLIESTVVVQYEALGYNSLTSKEVETAKEYYYEKGGMAPILAGMPH